MPILRTKTVMFRWQPVLKMTNGNVVPQLCFGGIQGVGCSLAHTDVMLASAARDDDDDTGDEVPPFYIYKLPIVRFSGCYWYLYLYPVSYTHLTLPTILLV